MKVYIAIQETDYSPSTVIGAYTSQVLAQKACDEDTNPSGTPVGDSYSIEEFELDDFPSKNIPTNLGTIEDLVAGAPASLDTLAEITTTLDKN
jgi:hypothetical protein